MNFLENLMMRASDKDNLASQTQPIIQKFAEIAQVLFPVVIGVAAVLIIIKLILLGMKLAQNGDDPEERSRIIKGMIWWGIGLLVAIAAITSSALIFNIISAKQ